MSYLDQIGAIGYNGYTLAGPRNSVQLEVIPVYDTTERFVTHSIYRFSIDAWITSNTSGIAGDGTDASAHMTVIRGALQKSGGALSITGFGFGDVTVNTTESDRDVGFGPKTLKLEMRNIGNGCIVLFWIIEAAIKTCTAGSLSGYIGRLKEYVYNVRWSIKQNGCTVRTVEGHLEVFQAPNQVLGTALRETADEYRDLVKIPPPGGFLRVSQDYRLSENKCRLYFRVMDEEQESPNAFPDGVANMELKHRVVTSVYSGNGINNPVEYFEGYVEVAKPYRLADAWTRVLRVINERVTLAIRAGSFPLLKQITIEEEVFARRVNFSLTFLVQKAGIQQMLTNTGLFTQVQSTNALSHRKTMRLAWGNRGAANLQHDPSSEYLVDQCSDNREINITDRIAPYFWSGSTAAIFVACPPESQSWTGYQNIIGIEGQQTIIGVQEMPVGPVAQTGSPTELFGANGLRTQLGGNPRAKRSQHNEQAGDGQPRIRVIVRGRAQRVGHAIPVPKLVEIMGREAKFNQSYSRTNASVVGYYNNCPIYEANWYHVYDVEFNTLTEMNAALKTTGLGSAVFGTFDDNRTPPAAKK